MCSASRKELPQGWGSRPNHSGSSTFNFIRVFNGVFALSICTSQYPHRKEIASLKWELSKELFPKM
jgi:hypothetical protein